MTNDTNFCVILAGGKGKRLWPVSRESRPKQFIDFFGTGRTQLQSTYDRVVKIIPKDNIYICTCKEYLDLVAEQLPDVDSKHVLPEPVNRGTAPCVAWAGWLIHQRCNEARVLVTPSDQLVQNEEAFCQNVLHGLDFVAGRDLLLTMGIWPTRPEPGYGYIQIGEPTVADDIHKVQSFTEKPEREFARIFMESGEFMWNTGLLLTDINCLRQSFLELMPDMPNRLASLDFSVSDEYFASYLAQYYPQYPNMQLDRGLLEHNDRVYVMKCDFGWADLGTWHAAYEYKQHGEGDNVVIDSDVMMENCRNNVVRLPKGRLAIIDSLDGYIVAEEGNVLLICPKGDSSALIKKYQSEMLLSHGTDYV